MSSIEIQVARLEERFEGHVELMAEKISGVFEHVEEHGAVLKGCVADLKEGAKVFYGVQGAIKEQNTRLKAGEEKFIEQDIKVDQVDAELEEHRHGAKGDHKVAGARFHKHVHGKDGAHAATNNRLTFLIGIILVLIVVLITGDHGQEVLDVLARLPFLKSLLGG